MRTERWSESGAVGLAEATPIGAAVSGNDQYNVNGTGSLSVYGPAGTQLGVSGDWTAYSATVSGGVSITLTTDGLSVDGVTLPAGTLHDHGPSVTLTGSGPSTSPNFTGSVSITATGDTVNLGPWTGNLAAGGRPARPSNVATFDGYSGTIAVAANGNGTDAVSLDGGASNVLQVSASPSALTTDQNTPVRFAAKVQTNLADTYTLTAEAPQGWNQYRQQRQRHRDARAGLQGGTLSYPDHRHVADRSRPGRAGDRGSDDHSHAARPQLHRRPRPALHGPLQRC